MIDPDEFFDYYEATGWVRAGGADRPMEERREHLAPQARAALRP
ncbi:MAG: hypothetical protein ACLT98_00090 [Eggerthellaceae bacterium]